MRALFSVPVATCAHCRRPITKPRAWLHTDGFPDCLDEWRWDKTGTFAEPEETPVTPVPPKRHRSYNDVRNWR